jgi:hypothetical protein
MLTGFLGNIAANLLGVFTDVKLPVYLDPILLGSACSFIAVFTVSAVGTVSVESKLFRERLHRLPEKDKNRTEIARTLLWPKAMIVIGLVVMALMINFYAKPYHYALQKNSESQSELRP